MRTAFIEAVTAAAARDPRVTLVVGDLGYSVVEPFAARFPNQFLNAAVSEQHMTGVAAGLALSGRIVLTYSIANFPILRCLEQIRNDICYHNANVKIVSVGGGFAYGSLGVSHHATEDLAIMRVLPNMTVLAPGDRIEARYATEAALAHPGPCYLRLGKIGEPVVHDADRCAFELGRAIRLRAGSDVTLISTGGMLPHVVEAASILTTSRGVSTGVLSMHTLQPLDVAAIHETVRATGTIVTVEEHSVAGGLGGAVAEVLAELGDPHARLARIGLPSRFSPVSGSRDFLRGLHGLSVDGIVRAVENVLVPSS